MITGITIIIIAVLLGVITHMYEKLNTANEYKEELKASIDSLEELIHLSNDEKLSFQGLSGFGYSSHTSLIVGGKKREINFGYGENITGQVEKIKADIALEKKVEVIASNIAKEAIDKNERVKKEREELTDLYNRAIGRLNFSSLHIDDYVPSKKKTTKKATTKKKAL